LKIVCQSRKIPQYNITLVDGFAGGGVYQSNKPGSPLVMIDAVREANFEINKDRSKRIKIKPDYFFIEEDRKNYESLENTFNKKELGGKCINVRHGDFNLFLPEILSHIKKGILKAEEVLFFF
jgi:three-Cys-motif partner protein